MMACWGLPRLNLGICYAGQSFRWGKYRLKRFQMSGAPDLIADFQLHRFAPVAGGRKVQPV
jgi:hypothetical protein